MRLNKLELRNFRNYQELVLEFPNRLNVFLGENAQGKTNLLESIYVLALTRSHRTSSEQELIGWQDDFAHIKGRIERGTSGLELELLLTKKGRKSKVNHIEQKKIEQLHRSIKCHFICARGPFFSEGESANQKTIY